MQTFLLCYHCGKLYYALYTTSVLKPTGGYWGGGVMVTDAKQFWGLQFMVPIFLGKTNVACSFGWYILQLGSNNFQG